jgi:transcriptional regulator with XRE-family HTH domain
MSTALHPKRLHRVATVRRQEGMSKRSVARKLKVSIRDVDELENEFRDLSIETLYRWAAVLKVPVIELLLPLSEETPTYLKQRGQLVQMMKTVEMLRKEQHSTTVKRLIGNLRRLLLAIMPELVEVRAWPKDGAARCNDRISRIELHVVRDSGDFEDAG